MIRKICSILVAVLCIAGFSVATSGTADAARTVIAKRGAYQGMDHQGNVVRFHFAGNDITNFSTSAPRASAARTSAATPGTSAATTAGASRVTG